MYSPTQALSEYVAEAKFEDIPGNVVKHAKDCILDSVGCTIGGAALDHGKMMIDFYSELGGPPEATILATGEKLPCMHTAYVNSYLSNLLDFDDYAIGGHLGATIIPPGLALAEKIRASGKDFITAVVIAYEALSRIAESIASSPERRAKVWGLATHQIFGSAIVACKLLKFNSEQTANTLGLSGASAPVPFLRKFGQELQDRPIGGLKNNYGWASMGGILSASLTQRGLSGNKHIFDGEKGFWIMASSDQRDFEKMTLNLGRDYLITRAGFKNYASCYFTHTSLDAIALIMVKHKVNVNEISSIRVKTFGELVSSFGVTAPANILDAQFSLPHLIALELLGKSPSKGLSEDNLADPKVRTLAEKVSIELSPEAEEGFLKRMVYPSSVSIEQTDGSAYSETVDIPKGAPERKLTEEEVRAKFMRLSAPLVGAGASEAFVHNVEELEKRKDVSIVIPMRR